MVERYEVLTKIMKDDCNKMCEAILKLEIWKMFEKSLKCEEPNKYKKKRDYI